MKEKVNKLIKSTPITNSEDEEEEDNEEVDKE